MRTFLPHLVEPAIRLLAERKGPQRDIFWSIMFVSGGASSLSVRNDLAPLLVNGTEPSARP